MPTKSFTENVVICDKESVDSFISVLKDKQHSISSCHKENNTDVIKEISNNTKKWLKELE